MARHLFFIDPLEKLTLKKDSSLFLAHELQEKGEEVLVFFEDDLQINTESPLTLGAYPFQSRLEANSFYVKEFTLQSKSRVKLTAGDTLHMRLDPPFDLRYLRSLWMLSDYQRKGIGVMNSASGILLFNEKMLALTHPGFFVPTYLGRDLEGLSDFLKRLKGSEFVIMKPLDLYQGLGVEKISLKDDVTAAFKRKIKECGTVMVQPYQQAVEAGETRAIYFKGHNLGNILKVPKVGGHLANIAQGATYTQAGLSRIQKERCEAICADLAREGVHWVAFDLIGDLVSEANITCPGLLVEVSLACGQNLAKVMVENF